MGKLKVLVGDCKKSLKKIPDASVQMCVTSPPYYGLRDYGNPAQIGLEETPEQYIESLVEVFREVKRTLKDDGVLWLNIGDSYYNPSRKKHKNLKGKDLIGIPWMLAFALRQDGWYLRQDIIWQKTSPMPESVRDRCTGSHEYMFLLAKSPKYYFDNEAIKTPVKQDWGTRNRKDGKYHNEGTGLQPHSGLEKSYSKANKRSVWTLAPQPFKGAHFAVYPPDLILPCILAGSRKGDTVLDPFGGSGTTAAVAKYLNRNAILCELNPEYAKIMPQRVESVLANYAAKKKSPLTLLREPKNLRKVKKGSADLIVVEKFDLPISEISRIKSDNGSAFVLDRKLSVKELTELILSNTTEGQTVFSPNIRKGRIGVVCAKLNRRLIGIGHKHYDEAKEKIVKSYRKHYKEQSA
ncbi:putative DNA adenine methylase [Dickeya phage vB_DsoM_JA33]|uniref:site-specific DNA-methyltransferase (cytosine-N(4)-specific) n=2 Tax=Salmondvirus JA11 TaxID=2734141 RepID=A0A386K5Y9_9CAUD|nr:DNA methyltransferase [Dickeya phage vB_DsoM_JA11]AXG67610.1 putative DNA adenine methylase [Dickeya phage vB_DsoM_JA33]AYD80040.1 putative DNA adenine methylase [Dickeya phage vB_DsoM_JA11]